MEFNLSCRDWIATELFVNWQPCQPCMLGTCLYALIFVVVRLAQCCASLSVLCLNRPNGLNCMFGICRSWLRIISFRSLRLGASLAFVFGPCCAMSRAVLAHTLHLISQISVLVQVFQASGIVMESQCSRGEVAKPLASQEEHIKSGVSGRRRRRMKSMRQSCQSIPQRVRKLPMGWSFRIDATPSQGNIRQTATDGNCFWRAMAGATHGRCGQHRWMAIKQAVMETPVKNLQAFFMTKGCARSEARIVAHHVRAQKRNGCWADVFSLMATTYVHQTQIQVYTQGGLQVFGAGAGCVSLMLEDGHYSFLENDSAPRGPHGGGCSLESLEASVSPDRRMEDASTYAGGGSRTRSRTPRGSLDAGDQAEEHMQQELGEADAESVYFDTDAMDDQNITITALKKNVRTMSRAPLGFRFHGSVAVDLDRVVRWLARRLKVALCRIRLRADGEPDVNQGMVTMDKIYVIHLLPSRSMSPAVGERRSARLASRTPQSQPGTAGGVRTGRRVTQPVSMSPTVPFRGTEGQEEAQEEACPPTRPADSSQGSTIAVSEWKGEAHAVATQTRCVQTRSCSAQTEDLQHVHMFCESIYQIPPAAQRERMDIPFAEPVYLHWWLEEGVVPADLQRPGLLARRGDTEIPNLQPLREGDMLHVSGSVTLRSSVQDIDDFFRGGGAPGQNDPEDPKDYYAEVLKYVEQLGTGFTKAQIRNLLRENRLVKKLHMTSTAVAAVSLVRSAAAKVGMTEGTPGKEGSRVRWGSVSTTSRASSEHAGGPDQAPRGKKAPGQAGGTLYGRGAMPSFDAMDVSFFDTNEKVKESAPQYALLQSEWDHPLVEDPFKLTDQGGVILVEEEHVAKAIYLKWNESKARITMVAPQRLLAEEKLKHQRCVVSLNRQLEDKAQTLALPVYVIPISGAAVTPKQILHPVKLKGQLSTLAARVRIAVNEIQKGKVTPGAECGVPQHEWQSFIVKVFEERHVTIMDAWAMRWDEYTVDVRPGAVC